MKDLKTGGSIINVASFVSIMGAATPQVACELCFARFSPPKCSCSRHCLQGSCPCIDPRACYGARSRWHPVQCVVPVSPFDAVLCSTERN